MTRHLIAPYGRHLINLVAVPERQQELKEASAKWPELSLEPGQVSELELLMNGGLSPLSGYMTRAAYDGVCEEMRLPDGALWPLPVTLDVDEALAAALSPGDTLALRNPEGVMLAVLHLEEIWRPDRRAEARQTLGTDDPAHPGVARLLDRTDTFCLGGRVEGLEPPLHFDFQLLRHSPAELRNQFFRRGWRRVAAFHTHAPMHRAEHALTLRAVKEHGTNLLIHPVLVPAGPGEVDPFTTVRCLGAILDRYPRHTAMMSLLPLPPREAGPREVLLHGIVRRNHGCSHLIMDRRHDGGAADAARDLFREHQDEIEIELISPDPIVHIRERADFRPAGEVEEGEHVDQLSTDALMRHLDRGTTIPAWFSFSDVIAELKKACPPRHRQGFTVFFTGLSGAGKSTIANVLVIKLQEMGGRPVTLLDGDIVRTNLSSELTFSKEHRDINIRRIGFVASEITKNGGIAICAPIAPYDTLRRELRGLITPLGGFILVHVATPLAVCESRDRKGMYAKARAGIVKEFTGISDPYEAPEDAEVVLETSDSEPHHCVQQVLLYLEKAGYISGQHNGD